MASARFDLPETPGNCRDSQSSRSSKTGPRLCLPQGHTFFNRFVARLFFHGMEGGDALDYFFGDGRTFAFMDVDELAAHMNHASLLAGAICPEQPVEPGEAIGMHHTFIPLEVG